MDQVKMNTPSMWANLDAALDRAMDYFIPRQMQVDPAAHRRARMFMLSHFFGPFLGGSIPIYIWLTGITIDYRFWVFTLSILAFWIYPFILRATERYLAVALISLQNLSFCIFWACYSYGGIFSPFLSWAIIIPLLSFLYLPAESRIRNVLLAQIVTAVGFFALLVVLDINFPATNLDQFQIIGMISMVAAAAYMSMMSLYFAKMFRDQRDFETELGKLVEASGDLSNLTDAANQARTAKADFVASMSHEMRTPLNAIIGYSQLLLEDAELEGDEDKNDIENIHVAGAALLDLIDDILDISKIDAGRMANLPSANRLEDWWAVHRKLVFSDKRSDSMELSFAMGHATNSCMIDWSLLTKTMCHLLDGLAEENVAAVRIVHEPSDEAALRLRFYGANELLARKGAADLFDLFADVEDAGPTKYGRATVKLALACKYAELMNGTLSIALDNGEHYLRLDLPHSEQTSLSLAA